MHRHGRSNISISPAMWKDNVRCANKPGTTGGHRGFWTLSLQRRNTLYSISLSTFQTPLNSQITPFPPPPGGIPERKYIFLYRNEKLKKRRGRFVLCRENQHPPPPFSPFSLFFFFFFFFTLFTCFLDCGFFGMERGGGEKF